MVDVDIRLQGDAAVLAVLGERIDEGLLAATWSLARSLRERAIVGVLDVVPAYASVLVRFDPFAIDCARVMALVRGVAERTLAGGAQPRRRVTIRVCFGGRCGVDFETTAHELGMREARFRDAFCKAEYAVAFLGFVAGFPYLVGLPAGLRVPRLATPRPRVPAGSVAIAAGQCGIYPRESPGGWRLLGRTAAPLFDPQQTPAALLGPSDVVCFEAVPAFDDTRAVTFGAAP